MQHEELCSYCYITLHMTMQSSPYSAANVPWEVDRNEARLEYMYSQCGLAEDSSQILAIPRRMR
jgi:hypothetical protein